MGGKFGMIPLGPTNDDLLSIKKATERAMCLAEQELNNLLTGQLYHPTAAQVQAQQAYAQQQMQSVAQNVQQSITSQAFQLGQQAGQAIQTTIDELPTSSLITLLSSELAAQHSIDKRIDLAADILVMRIKSGENIGQLPAKIAELILIRTSKESAT